MTIAMCSDEDYYRRFIAAIGITHFNTCPSHVHCLWKYNIKLACVT